MSAPTAWHDVLSPLFDRYAQMLRLPPSAAAPRLPPDLLAQALALAEYAPAHLHDIDEGKANRWLGFVQGIAIAAELTTVQDERNYTRPLFHALKGPSATHDVTP